jgi:hypothetical protein
MHLEQDQSRHPRLLRKPSLAEISSTSGIEVKKKGKQQRGSRFVNPTQLDGGQKSRICEALWKQDIGDEMGRQIFVGAVEYQISAFAQWLERPPSPEPKSQSHGSISARGRTPQAVVEAAANLSRLLRELPDGAQLRVAEMLARKLGLGRDEEGRYLCELNLEIDRLERACIAASAEPASSDPGSGSEPRPEPSVGRELVAKLAGIFSECFEKKPTAEEGGAFHASLLVLGEVTGLAIPHEPAFLAQALAGQVAKGK